MNRTLIIVAALLAFLGGMYYLASQSAQESTPGANDAEVPIAAFNTDDNLDEAFLEVDAVMVIE